ncbi:MAG: hypothetical protein IPJ52_14735 [Rhodocyclaceae bacterium]|nr:hypothetical protein [Rhodocyclaceae bacterium]
MSPFPRLPWQFNFPRRAGEAKVSLGGTPLTVGWLAVAGMLSPCVAHAAEPPKPAIATESVVRFNTLCATCHEGECSSRLSFKLDASASDNHVRRYAGDIASATARELAALLEHMKLQCGYYEIQLPTPADGRWRAELLRQLHAAQENAWFVPLGPLPAGPRRFVLQFDGDAVVSVQLISSSFEIEEQPAVTTVEGRGSVTLGVHKPGAHYLRLRADRAVRLRALDMEANP